MDNRDQWLAERQLGIGASEAAAVCGDSGGRVVRSSEGNGSMALDTEISDRFAEALRRVRSLEHDYHEALDELAEIEEEMAEVENEPS